MQLNDWYNDGMSVDDYIESMTVHKESLLHIYDHFQLPKELPLVDQSLRIIVLTEDWCGDAMLNIPILLRVAEENDMSVRILLRDDNLELMDQYLTNGKSRSIPIFIFIDEDGKEVAKWGPRAEKIQEFVDNAREQLPPKEATDFEEKQKEMLLFLTKSYRDNQDMWNTVYNSIKNTLV
ncbi:thioredoxin family protein [Oceanobacillus sp. 1P07AA]|uniref:thioredoxin family protein n=1 Tax=Oceanobacillus sp. 1P07AA TaxID=3132293 RepID=UPI0039A47747